MSEDKQTKRCPFCDGEIDIEAKKCKHCGEWLNKENQNLFTNKNKSYSIGCLIVIVFVALMLFGNTDDKKGEFDAHKANDINNALFDNIPPGSERRHAEANKIITSEKVINKKMSDIREKIKIINDRRQAGFDIDENELRLLCYKINFLQEISDPNNGGGYWAIGSSSAHRRSYLLFTCDAGENGNINDGPDCLRNIGKIKWDYVHLQEFLDKGSITKEEFEKKKQEIISDNQRILNDIETVLNFKEIPQAHSDFQPSGYEGY